MKTLQKALQGAAVVAAVVASASVAKADLTLQGAVGLPLNPTAQIPEQGAVRVQGNYAELGQSTKLYGLYAAGRAGDNIEINGGIERLSASGGYKRSGVAFGGKYLFTRESDPAGVRLAAGAGYSRAQFDNVYGYAVASKYFGSVVDGRVPITGHLGVRYDRFGGGLFGNSNRLSVYAGAEVPVTRSGNLAVVGELQSKVVRFSGASAPYSLSVRYRPQNQGFSASVGLMRRGILSNDSRIFAQLGYTFGGSVAGSEGAIATTATPSPSDTTTTTSSTTTTTTTP